MGKNVVFPANMTISVQYMKTSKKEKTIYTKLATFAVFQSLVQPRKNLFGGRIAPQISSHRRVPTHTHVHTQTCKYYTHTQTESDGAPETGYPHCWEVGKTRERAFGLICFLCLASLLSRRL